VSARIEERQMTAHSDEPAATGAPIAIVPAIMSGGAGTRLWPLSTETTPKQFHRLTSDKTMIQETVLRARDRPDLRFSDPILICNRRHVNDVRDQLAAVGVRPSLIVAEPFGRNTAAVALIAARLAAELHPGALVLLQPADHLIGNDEAFAAAIAAGARARDRIVTFGIEPTEPHEGYGYIQASKAIGEGLFGVERFVEKPSRAVAEAYLSDGGYYWNSGIFLFAPEIMAREFSIFRRDITKSVTAALASARLSDGVLELQDEDFARIPSESIDVAVMERTRSAAVVACDIGWADIGSWSELWRLGPFDSDGNRLHGRVMALETKTSLVWSEGIPIGVIGLDDVVVVAANGAVLVAAKSHLQKVRALAAKFAEPETDPRP
jgi:mannose-1-phosphate guanylyltransferase/mannose-6-phosphate isomerase